MNSVGLTGGIGSGKSLVATIFQRLGIPIYIADERAKYLMAYSEPLQIEIQKLFGPKAYIGKNELNRAYISDLVFKDKKILLSLNGLVHPAVLEDYHVWVSKIQYPYHIYESALLFETGLYKNSFKNILVTAPEKIRIRRVMLRDHLTEIQVKERIKNQWVEENTRELADFIIVNDGMRSLTSQVVNIHQSIWFDATNPTPFLEVDGKNS